jgi:hypothetical protein
MRRLKHSLTTERHAGPCFAHRRFNIQFTVGGKRSGLDGNFWRAIAPAGQSGFIGSVSLKSSVESAFDADRLAEIASSCCEP